MASRPRVRIVARIAVPRSLRSPFVLGSAAVHVLLGAALVLAPSLRARSHFPDSFVVDLVAPGPAAPPAAKPPQPPPERPEPATPVPAKPPAEGVRVEPEEPKITKKEKKKEEKVAPQAPPPDAAPPSEDLSPEMADDGAEVGGGLSGANLEDSALSWYQSSVTATLYSHWQRPILSGVRETLEVAVAFEIERDGSVTDLRVTQPSGVPSLDRSALRAVADADPLPPLPSHWRHGSISANFIFRLHPEGV